MLETYFYSVMALIPVTILLTISFFVLVVMRKGSAQALKWFGYLIVVLLWICAVLMFYQGMLSLSSG